MKETSDYDHCIYENESVISSDNCKSNSNIRVQNLQNKGRKETGTMNLKGHYLAIITQDDYFCVAFTTDSKQPCSGLVVNP